MCDVDIHPASDLATEALNVVGNRLAEMEEPHFTVFLLAIINAWAQNFVPEQEHAEFFNVIADNVRKLSNGSMN